MASELVEENLKSVLSAISLCKKIVSLETVDSTNTYARNLAQQGAEEGTLVITEAQTAGKGRQGRSWFTEPGKNLSFSLVLRPRVAPERMGVISLVAGLAVAEAIGKITNVQPVCKWPNDVLLDGKKVSGILSESVFEKNKFSAVIVGIGININQQLFPDDITNIATSLFMSTGTTWDRGQVLATVFDRLQYWYDVLQTGTTETILETWKSYATMFGKNVTVNQQEHIITGIAAGLAEDGGLILTVEGRKVKVLAGDVTLSQ